MHVYGGSCCCTISENDFCQLLRSIIAMAWQGKGVGFGSTVDEFTKLNGKWLSIIRCYPLLIQMILLAALRWNASSSHKWLPFRQSFVVLAIEADGSTSSESVMTVQYSSVT